MTRRFGCWRAWLLPLLLCLPLSSCDAARPAEFVPDGGSPQTLASLRGRWVLVNYWAEWCAPCRHEIPELNALQAERRDLSLFAVNYDELRGASLRALVRKMGIAFPSLVVDPGPALGVPRPEVLPTTIVIDPQGRMQVLVGPQTRASLLAILATSPRRAGAR